ncbi:glycoside hydrolase family 127 protein [Luteolibacter soli]|uniref:Beta-L-arabinofuranosidase domain-containing protein n=1 Tax=Luteolibacter soli TaxID=3135280 RepID=A0ABU9B300_9BACT
MTNFSTRSGLVASAVAFAAACSIAHGGLTLTNGNFESLPASDNRTDITGWYDYDAANFWEQAWLEGIDTPDDYNFSLAMAGDGNAGKPWAYQAIGTADGATTLKVTFDYGSFADATNLRNLGVTWKVYAVTGSFTPGQNVDINGASGVTLLSSGSASAMQVAPGAKVGLTTVDLDVSNAGTRQLYLRVSNFSPTTNSNGNGYLWVDQVSISANTLPPVATPLVETPIEQVQVNDAFWSPKLDQWRATTVNDVFNKFEQNGGLANFDLVASGATTGHRGENWWDGLIYETIRGAADLLRAHSDAVLEARIDGFIDRIGAAANVDSDGYINTAQQLHGPDVPVGFKWANPPTAGDTLNDNNPHTIYNAGCLVEAGLHYYRATGKVKLLKIATRQANYMTTIMGPSPKVAYIPGHAQPEEAFLRLYQFYRDHPAVKGQVGLTINEQAYLDLAKFWVETRGYTAGRVSEGAYNQDAEPVFSQQVMVGHAVRAGLLASGVAAIGSETRDPRYVETGRRWWQNLYDARSYLTGGMGAIAAHEGFGEDYELPNDGYCETCAAVTGGFFSHQMNLATGDGRYVDLLERELYNGALSGIALDGQHYFYENPLTAPGSHRRWSWAGEGFGMTPCCPPMFLKLMGALPGYIYATKDSGLYVNLYVGSQATIQTSALNLNVSQTSSYPWNGDVEITINPVTASAFTVNLHIPGWVTNPTVAINNGPVQSVTPVNQYASITRTWSPGDKIHLSLPMPIKRVKADSRVKADIGRVAITRGPVVYCFEGIDNNEGAKSILLGGGDPLEASFEPGLLGGVMTISGRSTVVRQRGGVLRKEPGRIKAIPFFTNANREPSSMDVWIADDHSSVQPVYAGVAAASYCNPGDSVAALNDGIIPVDSDDGSVPRMTWWNHKGTSEWAQITYDSPRPVAGVGVYWWDESRVTGDCRVPQSWSVQYLDAQGSWQPVQNASPRGVAMDRFNYATFDSVNTRGIRIVAQLQAGWSGGILEMLAGSSWPVPTASYTFASDTVTAINDGVLPASSGDGSISRHTYWNHTGTAEWAQITFPSAKRLNAFEIYWWDDRVSNGGCRVPASWSLSYLNGQGSWQPVQITGSYGVARDAFNTVNFAEVETTALRVQANLQAGWSGGILEMRAYEPSLDTPSAFWLADNHYEADTNMDLMIEGQGVSLLEAYALGLDPSGNVAGSMPHPSYQAGSGLSLNFWGAREDVIYGGEVSGDLKNWSPTGLILSPPDANGRRTVVVPPGAPSKFVRLRFDLAQ